MKPENTLKNKVALVTGGGSGIGYAISQYLAQSGAKVLITDVADYGLSAANDIGAEFLQYDLSSMDQVRDLAKNALTKTGNIDILINNAGLQYISPVDTFPDDEWAKLIQIMLIAPFQLTKAVVPGMKKHQWGRIINLSSIHGLVASPYKSAYVSAKHGIIGLTKTVALEVGDDGITVNAICPSYVRTPLTDGQIAAQASTRGIPEEEVISKVMLEPAAIKQVIEPEEVASLAMFLISNDAKSITGSSYSIDVGWTAR